MQRDVERITAQVELVTQRVASELLLFKDNDRRLCVKRLLSLWSECRGTMLPKGSSSVEGLVSLK